MGSIDVTNRDKQLKSIDINPGSVAFNEEILSALDQVRIEFGDKMSRIF